MQKLWRDDFPKTTNPLRFLWYASRPHLRPMAIAITAVAVAATMNASISYVFKLIANAAAKLPAEGAYNDLMFAAIAYILITTLSHLIWRMSGFAGALWANGTRATARHALTSYV